MHSRVILFRVATSVPAQWSGPDAGGEEIEKSRAYLEAVRSEFAAAGVQAQAELAYGDPVREIVKRVEERGATCSPWERTGMESSVTCSSA